MPRSLRVRSSSLLTLDELLDRKPAQPLAVATARGDGRAARNPRVYLLDEPLEPDAQLRPSFADLKQLHQRLHHDRPHGPWIGSRP